MESLSALVLAIERAGLCVCVCVCVSVCVCVCVCVWYKSDRMDVTAFCRFCEQQQPRFSWATSS